MQVYTLCRYWQFSNWLLSRQLFLLLFFKRNKRKQLNGISGKKKFHK